jgi:opacity protein-like surface antigen
MPSPLRTHPVAAALVAAVVAFLAGSVVYSQAETPTGVPSTAEEQAALDVLQAGINSRKTTTTTDPTTTTTDPTTTTTELPTTTTTTEAPPPATTSPPPAADGFSEDFTLPSAMARFDYQLHNGANGGPCGAPNTECGTITATDRAEHDMNCGAPTTHRHIDAQPVGDLIVLDPAVSPLMYYCAPGGDPAKGHMMTVVETAGVASLSFSPKQTFTDVTRLCFDINTNGNIGAGKWVNAWIVPTASLEANGGRFDFADAPDLDPEQHAPGPNDFHLKYFDGSLIAAKGSTGLLDWWEWPRRASESATRFTQCVEQTAPNTLTYTRDLPADRNGDGIMDPGVAETVTRTGAGTLPTGPVRVIFQDGTYNPDKHGGTGGITQHWDEIRIS